MMGRLKMKSVHLTIPGEPKGKQRPRFNSRSNTVYTPEETFDYENYIKAAYRRYYGTAIAFKDELVCVSIKAYMSIPNNMPKYKRELINQGRLIPSRKPDIDNIVKIILDGLNKVAYTDDKQVAVLMASKHYIKDGEQPRVEISITEVM